MNGQCECPRGPWLHHHAFGGVYRCDESENCIQCQPIDRIERATKPDRPGPRDLRETR